jgi:hypothetical protein
MSPYYVNFTGSPLTVLFLLAVTLIPALLVILLIQLPVFLARHRIRNYLASLNVNVFTPTRHYMAYALSKGMLVLEEVDNMLQLKTPEGKVLANYTKYEASACLPVTKSKASLSTHLN